MYRRLICLFLFVFVLSLTGSATGQTGTGLRAEYYHWAGAAPPTRENAFRDLVITRIDPQVYCYWNPGFVAVHPDGLKPDFYIQPPPGVRSDFFSVRWTGQIEALTTEAYTFITGSDDGIRVWLNGEMIIEAWADQDRVETTANPVDLVKGRKYDLVVEGYENGGEAEWQLYWRTGTISREPVPQRALYPTVKAQDFPASNPVPADGAVIKDTWASIQWTAGPKAESHDVYFSDNFDDVDAGTGDALRGNQVETNYIVGFPGFPYPEGLVSGTTYYWRIDEVSTKDPNSPWRGAVWSFTVAPMTAFKPTPADGGEAVALDARLTWQAGFNAKLHYVHFGTDFNAVSNAGAAPPTGLTTYTPANLKPATVYYWRVDEFDGVSTHPGTVWSFSTIGAVGSPTPAYGARDVKHNQILKWVPGDDAASHQIYFGMDKDAVRSANTGSPEYKGTAQLTAEKFDPGLLEWNTSYYWRIDEVNSTNSASPWKGNVWPFTTANFFVVEDFEDFNDYTPDEIWNTWIDGFGTTDNGATAGYPNPDFAAGGHYVETNIVHSGNQSMPYFYDVDQKFAEATRTLVYPRNWTEKGVDTLGIWFKGDWINVVTPMYVAIANATGAPAAVYHNNPSATKIDVWTEWKIPLQEFANKGIDLTNVNTITLGFGDKNNLQPGGSGTVFFDDIRLYPPK